MDESNLTNCRGPCGLIKLRKQSGTFDGKNKRWVDQNGAMWVGRICPDCHRNRMKEAKRKERSKDCETK